MQAADWSTMQPMWAQALKQMDRSRQARGAMLDRAGYAPQPTPSTVLHAEPGMQVRRYGPENGPGPAVLLVPAPIKRAYIWDLMPEVSVVRRWLERGYRVYLAEWMPSEDADAGIADYAGRMLDAARRAAQADSGAARVVLAGHSLGGILAAVHACLHPDAVAAALLLEAPLHFDPDTDCFAPLVRATPDAGQIAAACRQVPGSFLNMMSAMAEPVAFQWERVLDRWLSMADPTAMATHMRVERWTHDEFALPGRLFTDIVESLYRNDALMHGTLAVGGRTVGPSDLRSPLLCVHDPRSKVIPPSSVLPFHEAAASVSKALLRYEGDIGVNLQHVGVLVGRQAHARLWPAIFSWLEGLGPGQIPERNGLVVEAIDNQ